MFDCTNPYFFIELQETVFSSCTNRPEIVDTMILACGAGLEVKQLLLYLPEHLKGPIVKLACSNSKVKGPYVTPVIGNTSLLLMTPLSSDQRGNRASQLQRSSDAPSFKQLSVSKHLHLCSFGW